MIVFNDFFCQAVHDLQSQLGVGSSELSQMMGYEPHYVKDRLNTVRDQQLPTQVLNSLRKITELHGMQLDMGAYTQLKKMGYKAHLELTDTHDKMTMRWVHSDLPDQYIAVLRKKADHIATANENVTKDHELETDNQAHMESIVSGLLKQREKMNVGPLTFDLTLTVTIDAKGNVLSVTPKEKA